MRKHAAKRRTPSTPAAAMSERNGKSTPMFVVAGLFLIGAFAAFGPALHSPFDFDDIPAIVHNKTIRSLSPPWAPLRTPPLGTAVSGRPVVNLTFALNVALNTALGVDQSNVADSRDAAVGFRIVNIVLHVLTALLLVATVRLTLRIGRVAEDFRARAAPLAVVIAGLWLIHPLQTEAVDYVSQRTEIIVSLFYLATLYAATRHWVATAGPDADAADNGGDDRLAKQPRSRSSASRWFAAAVLFCALGMASKEVMLTAPLVIALHDRAFLSSSWAALWARPRRRLLYLSLAATSLIVVALDTMGGRGQTVGFHVGITPVQYLVSQGWAIPRYLWLVVWPRALTYDYGQTPILGVAPVIGLCALGLVGGAALWCWRKDQWRWLGFLGIGFFLLLAPSSSIVPIRTEVAAERRMYLALAMAIIAVVVALARQVSRGRALRWGSIAAVALALITVSAKRSSDYRDPNALWTDAIAKLPTNARAYGALGVAMLREKPPRDRAADTMFARAIALDSTYLDSWLRRAAVATKEKRLGDAERLLLHVLSVAPDDSDATSKLGKVYLLAHAPRRAIPLLTRMAQRSTDPTAFADLGNAYMIIGMPDSAVAPFSRAVAANPTSPDAYRMFGAALVESGHGREAIAPLQRSLQMDPQSGLALGLLSIAFGQTGDADDAILAAGAAVDRANGDADLLIFAGRGLEAAHREDLAERVYGEAVRVDPENPDALTHYAVTQASRGDRTSAVRLLRRALASTPNYPPALQTLEALNADAAPRR